MGLFIIIIIKIFYIRCKYFCNLDETFYIYYKSNNVSCRQKLSDIFFICFKKIYSEKERFLIYMAPIGTHGNTSKFDFRIDLKI